MCGRFALDDKVNQLIVDFVDDGGDFRDWQPSYNIAPTQDVPVVFESTSRDGEIRRRAERARWSLTPAWSKTIGTKFPTFNARSETAAEKPMFAAAVKSKRALVPANGYYEWQTIGKTKTPYFIHPDGDELLMFAALYSWWADPAAPKDDDSRWHLTTTILTSDSVQTLSDIHDRNPVPLPRSAWEHWIDATVVGDQALVDWAVAEALPVADALRFREVGPVRGDGPELIEAVKPVADSQNGAAVARS